MYSYGGARTRMYIRGELRGSRFWRNGMWGGGVGGLRGVRHDLGIREGLDESKAEW